MVHKTWRKYQYCSLVFPSCVAACGHHLSLWIAIVLTLLSSASKFSTPLSSFSSSPLTHLVPPCTSHIVPLFEFYSIALPQGHICASAPSSSRLLAFSSSFVQVQAPYTKSQFRRFREVSTRSCKYVFTIIDSPNAPYISQQFILFYYISWGKPFLLSSLHFTSILYPSNLSMDCNFS